MADTSRVLVYSPQDVPLFELGENDVFERVRTEEINGEHSLSLTCTKVLEKGWRVLTCDGMGVWREYVVTGIDSEHAEGLRPLGTYFLTWSLQHDLTLSVVERMPGTSTPVAASVALAAALSGTARWGVGTVTQTTTGGASMWRMSGWQAIGVLLEEWGGELSATIGVDATGVVSRRCNLMAALGRQTATRRFDWGADVKGIRRKVADSPVACRVVPLGKGEQTEGGGYGRKIDITSVNDGKDYLQDNESAAVYRLPDGSGGWEYPTTIISNGDLDEPQALKDWALEVMEQYTRPLVTYSASVLQFAAAGMDSQGVALGDAVQCVDRGFGADGLRITGRVAKLVVNELDESDCKLTIGHIAEGLAGNFSEMSKVTAAVRAINGGGLSTADYLSRLIDRLNGEINASGGYTYITEGQGIRTYDRAVTDPLVGTEATKVVEIKGGSIRIADSKTAGGEWEWRTVFVSGHIAADMVTAANITSGYIGSAASGNFWNLDTGELQMAATTTVGGQTVQAIADSAANTAKTQAISAAAQDAQTRVANLDAALDQAEVFDRLTNGGGTQGIYLDNGLVYINGQYIQANSINATSINTVDLKAQRLGADATHYAEIGQGWREGTPGYNGLRYHDTGDDTGFFIGALSHQLQNEIWMGILDNNEDNDTRLQLNSNFVRITNDSINYPQVEIYGWRGGSGDVGFRFILQNSNSQNRWLELNWNDGLKMVKQESGSSTVSTVIRAWPSV